MSKINIDIYFIEESGTLLIGIKKEWLQYNRDPQSACMIPFARWLAERNIGGDDINEIAITNKSNFKEILNYLNEEDHLWEEFLLWRQNRQNVKPLAQVLKIDEDSNI